MDAIIRTAGPQDLPFLSRHDRHVALAELDNSLRLGRILIIEVSGEPAGWLRWNLFWDNTPFMNLLYLLEGCRGQGLGRALVRHWEDAMREAGYAAVMPSTQADEFAQHFYRHLGYCDAGGFALPGDPYELIMVKAL